MRRSLRGDCRDIALIGACTAARHRSVSWTTISAIIFEHYGVPYVLIHEGISGWQSLSCGGRREWCRIRFEDIASVTRFVLDHVNGLPTPGLMQSDASRVQLLTRTEYPITETRGAAKRLMSQTPTRPPEGWRRPRVLIPPGAPTTLACVKGRHLRARSGQTDSEPNRVKRGSDTLLAAEKLFLPIIRSASAFSSNDEQERGAIGENRILKRQFEDLTPECAKKDTIIKSLTARLEDAGSHLLQARLPRACHEAQPKLEW